MMSGSTLRRLVRETWKPTAGRRITVYVAASSAHTMPDHWNIDEAIPARGWLDGEVLGVARVRSGRQLPCFDTLDELVETIEDEGGEILYWEESHDDSSDGSETPTDDAESEDDPDDPDDDEAAETVCDDQSDDPSDDSEEEEAKEEAEAEDDTPTHEAFDLPEPDELPNATATDLRFNGDWVYELDVQANELDLVEGYVYQARVNNIVDYGVFVSLNSPVGSDVSGLVHVSKLPFARSPSDYEIGDPVYVMLAKRSDRGLSFDMLTDEIDDGVVA